MSCGTAEVRLRTDAVLRSAFHGWTVFEIRQQVVGHHDVRLILCTTRSALLTERRRNWPLQPKQQWWDVKLCEIVSSQFTCRICGVTFTFPTLRNMAGCPTLSARGFAQSSGTSPRGSTRHSTCATP